MRERRFQLLFKRSHNALTPSELASVISPEIESLSVSFSACLTHPEDGIVRSVLNSLLDCIEHHCAECRQRFPSVLLCFIRLKISWWPSVWPKPPLSHPVLPVPIRLAPASAAGDAGCNMRDHVGLILCGLFIALFARQAWLTSNVESAEAGPLDSAKEARGLQELERLRDASLPILAKWPLQKIPSVSIDEPDHFEYAEILADCEDGGRKIQLQAPVFRKRDSRTTG